MDTKIAIETLDLYYSEFHAAKKYQYADTGKRDYCIYRSFWLWQINTAEIFE